MAYSADSSMPHPNNKQDIQKPLNHRGIKHMNTINPISNSTTDEVIGNIARSCLQGQLIGKVLTINEQFTEMTVEELGVLIEQMTDRFNEIGSYLDDLASR